MKKFLIILSIILSVLLATLSWYTFIGKSDLIAVVWISGSINRESNYLFEIEDNGEINVTSGNIWFDRTAGKSFYTGDDDKRKTIKPEAEEMSNIKALVSEIGKEEKDKMISSYKFTEIIALINGKEYWFSNEYESNEKLAELTKILINVSDIPMENWD